MNLGSRNLIKDIGKTSRTSSRYCGEAPLSGRTINENLFQQSTLKGNYATRQSQQGLGIFTNQLNRKAGKIKEQRQLPIQFTQVLDYQNGKVRSSKKITQFQKQSRDQYANFQDNYGSYYHNEKQKEQLKKQLTLLKQEVEFSIMDKVKKMINDQSSKVRQSISDILSQTNNAFKKKQETLYLLKTENYGLKEQFGKLAKSYLNFCQQTEQKFQNVHVQLANLGGVKRSKPGEYNMDMKNSFQGLNSSLSGNLGSENQSSKLINEVIFQIDAIKKELAQNKAQMQQLNFEMGSKLLQLRNQKKDKNMATTDAISMKYEEISKLVRQILKEDKKCSKFQQKFERFESELFNIDFRIKNQEVNIQTMNNQISNIVNIQINPKLKKIQMSLADVCSRIDKPELQRLMKEKIIQDYEQRFKDVRTLKIRNFSKQEQSKLGGVIGLNENKTSYKQTYLLDQDNYLLDSQGNYLVQQISGRKERIKILKEQLYLLQLKGIEISTAV